MFLWFFVFSFVCECCCNSVVACIVVNTVVVVVFIYYASVVDDSVYVDAAKVVWSLFVLLVVGVVFSKKVAQRYKREQRA